MYLDPESSLETLPLHSDEETYTLQELIQVADQESQAISEEEKIRNVNLELAAAKRATLPPKAQPRDSVKLSRQKKVDNAHIQKMESRYAIPPIKEETTPLPSSSATGTGTHPSLKK